VLQKLYVNAGSSWIEKTSGSTKMLSIYGPCTPHSRGNRLIMVDEAITQAIVAIVNNYLVSRLERVNHA
jgi:hypothetical protein